MARVGVARDPMRQAPDNLSGFPNPAWGLSHKGQWEAVTLHPKGHLSKGASLGAENGTAKKTHCRERGEFEQTETGHVF